VALSKEQNQRKKGHIRHNQPDFFRLEIDFHGPIFPVKSLLTSRFFELRPLLARRK
jgi:hypothetical protein